MLMVFAAQRDAVVEVEPEVRELGPRPNVVGFDLDDRRPTAALRPLARPRVPGVDHLPPDDTGKGLDTLPSLLHDMTRRPLAWSISVSAGP